MATIVPSQDSAAGDGRSRVAVVIVNYRSADLVLDGLDDLVEECNALGGQLLIVDNCSPGDDGRKLLAAVAKRKHPHRIEVIESPVNGGFSYGNNVALRRLFGAGPAPDFIYFLNPDARVLKGAIAALVAFMDARPNVGVAGSAIRGPDGAPHTAAFRFHSIVGEFELAAGIGFISRILAAQRVAPPPEERTHQTDWVSGAAFMVRTNVFNDTALFDEGYFLYYEETDFMAAATRAGWEVWCVSESCVTHIGGASTGVVDGRKNDGLPPDWWWESRQRYFRKNHGEVYAVLADAAWVMGSLVALFRLVVTLKPVAPWGRRFKQFLGHAFRRPPLKPRVLVGQACAHQPGRVGAG